MSIGIQSIFSQYENIKTLEENRERARAAQLLNQLSQSLHRSHHSLRASLKLELSIPHNVKSSYHPRSIFENLLFWKTSKGSKKMGPFYIEPSFYWAPVYFSIQPVAHPFISPTLRCSPNPPLLRLIEFTSGAFYCLAVPDFQQLQPFCESRAFVTKKFKGKWFVIEVEKVSRMQYLNCKPWMTCGKARTSRDVSTLRHFFKIVMTALT